MSKQLEGKVAIVTGGSSGIGLAIARRFRDEGAHVFITGRRADELETARAALGADVRAVQGDVSNSEDVDRLYATARSERGRVDIVVTNAGIVEQAPLSDATAAHYEKMFDVNVRGTLLTVQKALPLLAEGGAIVLVSSCMNVKGYAGHSAYNATKAAVRSFARTWAAELKDRGIRVNCLSPGPIDTPIIELQTGSEDAAAEFRRTAARMVPLGRLGRPTEIASAALFLASSESSFATGIDLVIDGGMTQL
ncbi:SDR family NAD(P)-dependent oxidoreductase [Nannocystis pusilla]|uniref:SDR family NAD(P)-dependent oxidoreductase n=1 Tax=Nannocystis pusilla TaxID=889268 RepID=UPI003DA5CB10